MARNRTKKGRPVSGWVVLDKPLNMGSTQAVAKVKWLFGAQKAGHAGTLDPLASGVLPIALGEATKTVPHVVDGTKVYRFTVTWGEERTTDDLEGESVSTSDDRPSRSEVEALLPRYTGVIKQVPPAFSAIKLSGERAYDIARSGGSPELQAREVEIDTLTIIDHTGQTTTFEVECGKGTYVRSLARDMGRDLGCYGHVSSLRRTVVDPFEESDMVTLEALEAARPEADGDAPDFAMLDTHLFDAGSVMDHLPRVDVNDEQATRIRLGNPAMVRGRDAPISADEACAFHKNRLIAIGSIGQGAFQPKRVLKAGA